MICSVTTFGFCAVLMIIAVTGQDNDIKKDNITWFAHEHELYRHLLDGYEKEVRPILSPNETITVKFGVTLVKIFDVDEHQQTFYTSVWMRMNWDDKILTWNPKNFGNIKSINIPTSKIWTPDIVLYNSANENFQPSFESRAVVAYNGNIFWVPRVMLHSHCAMDLSKFPFDQQLCRLKFGSWTYSSDKVDIQPFGWSSTPELDLSVYSEHQEWDIINSTSVRHAKKYPCCEETYPDITYTIKLKRKLTYYTHLYIVPSILLALLIPICFVLPPESTEKIYLGGAILLGQVLLFMMMEQIVPGAHPTVPTMALYHLVNLAFVSLSLAIGALVKSTWCQGSRRNRMPSGMKMVFLGLIGRLLCVSRDPYVPMEELDVYSFRKLEDNAQDMDSVSTQSEHDRAKIVKSYTRRTAISEWRQLSLVLDRLFLVLFTAAVVIAAIVMMS